MAQEQRYTAIIELGKDMSYSICTQDWGDIIVGCGANLREAKESLREGIASLIESYEQAGQTEQANALRTAMANVAYRYDVRSFLKYYKLLNLSKFAEYIGINATLLRQYKAGQYMSEERALQIEAGFRQVAEDLSAMG